MSREFKFRVVDASRPFEEVNRELKQGILAILDHEEAEEKPRRNNIFVKKI
jgi:hypothetical protein